MPADNQPTPPVLKAPPRPRATYDEEYAKELYQWFLEVQAILNGVNYLRGGGLFLQTIPTSATGLKVGEVWSNAGVLTIVT